MAYDSARGVVVLFGGIGPGGNSGETWEWEGSAWSQRLVSGPSARNSHAMAFDSARNVVILSGGDVGNANPSADTWDWNGTSWTMRSVSGLSPRYYHTMAYDSARGVTALFGGWNSVSFNSQTWEVETGAWTLQTPSGSPLARRSSAMCYDSSRSRSVLFGGFTGNSTESDTWEWSGSSWSQLMVSGPSYRQAHAMAYDSARSAVVLFGGLAAGGNNGETWELRCAHAAVAPAAFIACPSAESGDFAATVVSDGPFTCQWQIQTAPDTWMNLGSSPVPLPACGVASAYATPSNSASVTIGLRGCVGDPAQAQHFRLRCLVTNACGNITGDEVAYTICPADMDCNGNLAVADIFVFLNDWFAGNPRTDFDGVDGLEVADVFAYLNSWFAGC